MPSGSQRKAHLAQLGANLSPWLPESKKESKERKRKGEKKRHIYNVRGRFREVDRGNKSGKKAESRVADGRRKQGACSDNGRSGKSLCVCVCEAVC